MQNPSNSSFWLNSLDEGGGMVVDVDGGGNDAVGGIVCSILLADVEACADDGVNFLFAFMLTFSSSFK